MSKRIEQVESVLHRAISEVITRELSDPRIRGLISVTKLDVSPDMHHCAVFISVLPGEYEKRSLAGLRAAAGHIYSRVCRKVALATVPKLDFRLDQTLKKTAEIYDAINQAREMENRHDREDETGTRGEEE